MASQEAAWTPSQIAKYWWTADAGITESGGDVSAWVDQVGGLSIDQPTAGIQPTLTTSANLNNQNVLNFDGNDWLKRNPISFASDGYAFTNIVIAYNNNGSAQGALVNQSYLGATSGRFGWLKNSNNFTTVNQAFLSVSGLVIESPATTGVKVAAFEYDAAGNVRTWLNDFNTPTSYSGGGTNVNLVQFTSLIFGGYNDTTTGVTNQVAKWNGDIAEVIWVPSTLSASDITNLQTYINTKYNLSV